MNAAKIAKTSFYISFATLMSLLVYKKNLDSCPDKKESPSAIEYIEEGQKLEADNLTRGTTDTYRPRRDSLGR